MKTKNLLVVFGIILVFLISIGFVQAFPSQVDSDGDGIPDISDQCDADPENYNGYQDSDGCPDNIPPVAVISANPTSGYAPLTVSFSGAGSYDLDGSIVSYYWNFGNGAAEYGQSVTYTYQNPGTYIATLTVTDNGGVAPAQSATAQVTINVYHYQPPTNQPPVAVISMPQDGSNFSVNETIQFNGSTSYDPDGSIVSYLWDFGDGTTSNEIEPTHNYSINGSYVIALTVTDNMGATSSVQITININLPQENQPPVVVIIAPADNSAFDIGEDITFEGAAYDPEDGDLTGNSLQWSSSIDGIFGYGENLIISNLSEGMHTITLTATDSQGLSGMDSIVIFIGNVSNITLPTVEIISPEENTSYNYSNILVNISSTNADSVTYSIDGGAEISYLDAFFNLFTDGWHTIVAIARNVFGIATDSVTFFVNTAGANDTTAPLIILISPQNNSNASNPVTFIFDVTDDSDVDGCNLIVDNTTIAAIDGINGENRITANLTIGSHRWQISCADAFGNTAYSEIRILNVLMPQPAEETKEEKEIGLYIGRINYDEIVNAGSEIEFSVSIENNGQDLKDLKLIISIQDLGIRAVVGPFDLDNGKTITKRATLEIPEDSEQGTYDVRITVQNEEVNRIKYREIEIRN